MAAPISVDKKLFVPFLINSVMFDRTLGVAEVKDHLEGLDTQELSIGEVKQHPENTESGPTLIFGVNGQYLVRVVLVDSPLTDRVAPAIHPILTGPAADKLGTVKAQALVSLHPNEGEPTREDRLAQALLHARVSNHLARLAGVVAIHNMQDSTTVAPHLYSDALSDSAYPVLMAPVWLAPDSSGDTFTGYTYGLHQLGHPELQATGISGDPTEAYLKLMNLANYVIGGATLKEGDTFSFSQDANPSTVEAGAWVISDKVPALIIEARSLI